MSFPDLPRWVEANGIVAEAGSWRVPCGAGFAVGSARGALIVASSDADPAAVAALASAHADHGVLAAIERADLATARAPTGRPIVRAVLLTLPDPALVPALEGAVALADDVALAHVPPPLAAELAGARAGGRTIWTAWVDDAPVAFAYAPWRTPTWFDVSVEVLPAARQLGLGAIVAAALIDDEAARGRRAVWGADEDNVASLRLAARLGFVATDAITVAPPVELP